MASNTPPIPGTNTSTAQNPAPDPPRQVAVIAIHGVGRHEPGASAEAIATLLASQDRADNAQDFLDLPTGPRRCSGYDIESIEVPLAAVATERPPSTDRNRLQKILGVFDERRGFLYEQRQSTSSFSSAQRRRGPQPPDQQQAERATVAQEALPVRGSPAPQAAPQELLFDYQYMLSQLADYKGQSDRTFQTMRYVSRRFAPIPGRTSLTEPPAPPTHIYDAHYSDLSKPENSVVGFFYAFYQLLFHLAALGLKAVYWAEAENSKPGLAGAPWRLLSTAHAVAVRSLIMFLPLLNLTMLLIGFSAFADKATIFPSATTPDVTSPVPNDVLLRIIGVAIAGLLGIVLTLVFLRNKPVPSTPFVWSLLPLAGTVGLVGIFWGLAFLAHQCVGSVSEAKWMALLGWLLLAGAAVIWISKKLAAFQPGADWVGPVLYAANAAVFVTFLGQESSPELQAATASLLSIQLLFGELALVWVVCLTAEFLAYPLSELCIALAADVSEVARAQKKARARSAHRTGRFAFAISASFFLIVTLAIWSGICSYAGNKLGVFDRVPALNIAQDTFAKGPWWEVVVPNTCQLVSRIKSLEPVHAHPQHPNPAGLVPSSPDTLRPGARDASCDATVVLREPEFAKDIFARKPLARYLDGLLLVSVTPGLPIILALIAVSFFLLVWAVAPSVIYEVRPKRTPPAYDPQTADAGEWLSRGLDNIAILIRVLWIAIVPVPIFFGVLDLLAWGHPDSVPAPLLRMLDWFSRLTLPLIQGTGAGLAVSAAAIIAIILKYGGAVLDTLLDVDNYLRTVPKECTPRARIAERITSLLRYVAAYRDPQGRPYERLVIVAHSLGTLVSADLLRFIARSRANDHDPVLHADGLHAGEDTPAIPIYLMTMGSPLRPLLNRFFPHLYEWVTPTPDNSSRSNRLGRPLPDQPKAIPPNALPEPRALCVKGWCNAYRSGDYVGRYLWNIGWLKRNQDLLQKNRAAQISLIQDASPSTRAEMCIGIGAHTHYWDRNAPDIAQVLRKLIRNPTQIFR